VLLLTCLLPATTLLYAAALPQAAEKRQAATCGGRQDQSYDRNGGAHAGVPPEDRLLFAC